MRQIKDFVRSRPRLYDRARALKRGLRGGSSASFQALDRFSCRHDRQINFIQIGANDGLRNDPLRPFVVRDDWCGVFIEPLPTVFPRLQANYAYLKREGLAFVNAAVTVDGSRELDFWSFHPTFLASQTEEQKLDYLRKASFDRAHVESFLPADARPDEVLERLGVPCLSIAQIVEHHLPRAPLHLLAIDAEGYEATLIPGIDFGALNVEAVFFESEHLGADKRRVFGHLEDHGFIIESVGLDSLAVR